MTTTTPLRVVVADDDVFTRTGVCLSLTEANCVVSAEVEHAAAAVEATVRLRPHVSLIDVSLPGDPLGAIATISSRLPTTAVVVLTTSHEDADLFGAIHAGAAGYLPKEMDSALLPRTLRAIARGEAALPRMLVSRLIEEFRDRSRAAAHSVAYDERLTSRQAEVLELLRAGLTTSQIAARLAVSDVTIRRHVSELLGRLGFPSRVAALHPPSD